MGVRLAVAQSQVEYVKTLSNKAITVLSAPRYPRQDDLKPYVPLHAEAPHTQAKHTRFLLENVPHLTADMLEKVSETESSVWPRHAFGILTHAHRIRLRRRPFVSSRA